MRRHIMHNNYDSMKFILAFEGIKDSSDINTLSIDEEGYIVSSVYPWVKDIYNFLEENNVAAQTEIAIWESDPGQYFQINGMTSDNKYHLSKFSCFFPGRTIVSAGDIKKKEDCYYIQASALSNFFLSDIISENDMGLYTPNSINGKTLRSIISGSGEKYRIADLDTVQESKNLTGKYNPIVDMLYVGLPWLYNARIEDYIELINKYENEFENYNNCIRELAKTATDEKELTQDIVNKINALKIDMSIKLEMKKEELYKKGIRTVVGVCLMGIPYLLSIKYKDIDPNLLNALIGGKSVFECANIVSDSLSINKLPKDNPLWVIWKWAQITQNNNKFLR